MQSVEELLSAFDVGREFIDCQDDLLGGELCKGYPVRFDVERRVGVRFDPYQPPLVDDEPGAGPRLIIDA